MKKITLIAGGLLLASYAMAQVGFTGAYAQNFNTLPATGNAAANAWTNNVTLTGWYGFRSNPRSDGGDPEGVAGVRDATPNAPTGIAAVTGGGGAGGFFSAGVSSTDFDRALAVIPSGSAVSGDWSIALVLQNTGNVALQGFTLLYVGEQWRVSTSTLANSWDFDYGVFTSFSAAQLNAANTTGYTNPANGAGDWTSPITTGAATSLNGNLAANRVAVSVSADDVWAPGSFLVLRWWDDNNPGDDYLLGIDDVMVAANPVPEPMTLIVLGGIALAAKFRTKKNRRN